MSENITVRGYVATDIRMTVAPSGLPIAGFRMCTTERRFDRQSDTWVDGHTNWYSVSMFRQLATNAAACVKKGDRVLVFGRLKVKPWINAEGKTGTNVEIDADCLGHDLMWGTAGFRRASSVRAEDQDSPANSYPAEGAHGETPAEDVLEVDGGTGEILDGAAQAGADEIEGEAYPGTLGAGVEMDAEPIPPASETVAAAY